MADKRKPPTRQRPIQVKFFVDEKELDLIKQKMAQMGTENMSAYLRKMAIDGSIIQVDTTDIKEMTKALGSIGRLPNNLTQRVTSTKRTLKKSKRIRKKFTKALKKFCFLFPI